MSNVNYENSLTKLTDFFDERLSHGVIPSKKEFISTSKYLSDEIEITEKSALDLYWSLLSTKEIEELLLIPNLEEIIFQDFNILKIKLSNESILKKLEVRKETILRIVKIIIIKNNKELNTKEPFCSFSTTLQGNLVRVTLLKNNHFPLIIFRLMNKNSFPLKDFCIGNSIMSCLKNSIQKRKSILIAGKTGSGKTSLLQTLIRNEIDSTQQVCIIEDLKEIDIESRNIIHLSTSEYNRSINDLISWALRLSPDRVIIGEIRSSEACGFLNILNTGHSGSIATIHANSAKDAIDRLAFLINYYNSEMKNDHERIKKQLVKFIDEIIYIENKKIKEFIKIKGTSNDGALYYEKYI
tara:strand:- start:4513 stop:5574 length:1062 start_codon:yes stop_codon:yes gene_type:complete